jgi:hypothetical protein
MLTIVRLVRRKIPAIEFENHFFRFCRSESAEQREQNSHLLRGFQFYAQGQLMVSLRQPVECRRASLELTRERYERHYKDGL